MLAGGFLTEDQIGNFVGIQIPGTDIEIGIGSFSYGQPLPPGDYNRNEDPMFADQGLK
jgi:hypothetical protein